MSTNRVSALLAGSFVLFAVGPIIFWLPVLLHGEVVWIGAIAVPYVFGTAFPLILRRQWPLVGTAVTSLAISLGGGLLGQLAVLAVLASRNESPVIEWIGTPGNLYWIRAWVSNSMTSVVIVLCILLIRDQLAKKTAARSETHQLGGSTEETRHE